MTTALTPIALPAPYAVAPATLTFTTTDGTATFWCDGMTFLVALNVGASGRTITISSIADPLTGRTGNITADPIAAGALRVYPIFAPSGWRQTTGLVNVTVSNAEVHLAACRIVSTPGFAGVQ